MTTLHNAQPGVVRRQYAKGMTLVQLSKLYDADVATLEPMVRGVVQKKRDSVEETRERTVTLTKSEQEERDRKMFALAEAGVNYAEIGRRFGLTRTYVGTRMRRLGHMTTRAGQNIINHDAYAYQVKQMMDDHMSNYEICEALNITYMNLQTIKRKHGLKLRKDDGGARAAARRQMRLSRDEEETT